MNPRNGARATFVLLALVVLLGGPARAATRTASASGLWCSTSTWGGASVPVATDTCTISSNVQVILDGSCSQVCADLSVSAGGSLSSFGGQTLTLGDPIASDVIINNGTISFAGGDTLELDCNAVATTGCEVYQNGTFTAHGTSLGQGRVASVSGENCPGNSDYRPADESFVATDCTDINLTVEGLGFIDTDDTRYMGKYIELLYPAAHRGTWYLITGTTAPNILTVDYDSEGQMRPKSHGPTNGSGNSTVTGGTASVSWAPGIASGQDHYHTIGSWYFCDADCPGVTNSDLASGTNADYTYYLPCGAARRIIGITTGTPATLTLKSNYTNNCSGAASHIVGSSQYVRDGYDYIEKFAAGDQFIVWNPVTLTIPDANRSLAAVQSYTTGGIDMYDDSTTVLDGVMMRFWGRSDQAFPDDVYSLIPVQGGFSSSNTTGTIDLEHLDIGWFSGGAAVTIKNPLNNATTLSHMTAHDALPTDRPATTSMAHGLFINQCDYAGGGCDLTIDYWRATRIGDDCMVMFWGSTGSPDTYEFNSLTINYPTCTFGPVISIAASMQAIDFSGQTDMATRDGLTVNGALFSNIQNGGFAPPASRTGASAWGPMVIKDSVIQNVQGDCIGNGSSSWAYDTSTLTVVNTLCRGTTADPASANLQFPSIAGANVYDSLIIGGHRGMVDADVVKGAMVYTDHIAGSTAIFSKTTTPSILTNEDAHYTDVAVWVPPCFSTGCVGTQRGFDASINAASTQDVYFDHFTYSGRQNLRSSHGIQASSVVTALVTATNSVFWDATTGFSVQAASNNLTESNNLFLKVTTPCTGANCPSLDASDLTTGNLGFQSLATPNLGPALNSTPFSTSMVTTNGDGTPAGARFAGPANWEILETIYPPLKELGRPGVRIPGYSLDRDGDGIVDLHDNCDTYWNPAQLPSEACE